MVQVVVGDKCRESQNFQVQSCGLFFSWWGKLFVISIAVFSSSFSVTLPGTYARHPALTRGKPIFLFSVVFGFLGVALFGLGFFFGFVVWVFPPININSYYLKFG